jgi:hypothetical protein
MDADRRELVGATITKRRRCPITDAQPGTRRVGAADVIPILG